MGQGEIGKQLQETDAFRATFPTVSGTAVVANGLVSSLVAITDLDTRKNFSGVVAGCTVLDKSKTGSNYLLWLFDDNPKNTTFTAGAALSLNSLDVGKLVPGTPAAVPFKVSDGANSYSATDGRALAFRCRSSTELYAALTTDGQALTFSAANAAILSLSLLAD